MDSLGWTGSLIAPNLRDAPPRSIEPMRPLYPACFNSHVNADRTKLGPRELQQRLSHVRFSSRSTLVTAIGNSDRLAPRESCRSARHTSHVRVVRGLRELIRRMARENPLWGQERIANELCLAPRRPPPKQPEARLSASEATFRVSRQPAPSAIRTVSTATPSSQGRLSVSHCAHLVRLARLVRVAPSVAQVVGSRDPISSAAARAVLWSAA